MDIKSRARVPQKRVQVGAPVFQPAGSEEQRLYTEPSESIPKTTDQDIQNRVDTQDRYSKLSQMMKLPAIDIAKDSQKARMMKDLQESENLKKLPSEDPMVSLDKEVAGQPPDDVDVKPIGTYEESSEEAKEKFKLQLSNAIREGSITPEEIEEIKRLGR